MPRIVAFVLAGGEGRRLRPYTEACPKPALPLGEDCRIIDLVLANLCNSGIRSIYVLAQYHARAILDHVAARWRLPEGDTIDFVQCVVPALTTGRCEFRGTADAVWQNLHLLDALQPELVAVFAADHVYRMDVRQMIAYHDARDADVSVATVPVPLAAASRFGVVVAGARGRVRAFHEKAARPPCLPARPGHALASMGNYLFRSEVLRSALERAARCGESDFGHHVLPALVHSHRVHAYDFSTNRIPGVVHGEQPNYWRDVGTVESYLAALRDTRGAAPRFVLEEPRWPLCPPAHGRVSRYGPAPGGMARPLRKQACPAATDAGAAHSYT